MAMIGACSDGDTSVATSEADVTTLPSTASTTGAGPGFPEQPNGVSWPTEQWPEAFEAAG